MQTDMTMTAAAIFAAVSAAFLAVVLAATPADAGGRSWSRSGSVTGPHGGARRRVAEIGKLRGRLMPEERVDDRPERRHAFLGELRNCANGSCTSQGSYTGAAGNTWNRSGTATYGGGNAHATGTITGPNGGTSTYDKTRSCSGGSCTSETTVTGPNTAGRRAAKPPSRGMAGELVARGRGHRTQRRNVDSPTATGACSGGQLHLRRHGHGPQW